MGDSTSPLKKKTCSSTDLELFDEVFPKLVSDIVENGLQQSEVKDALSWFKKVCEYNVPFGKKNRGLTVVHSYKYLASKVTENELQQARILGWCVELVSNHYYHTCIGMKISQLQAFFLITDDIMDDSITRRGQPCWYRKPGVGMIAINDALFLESAIYTILKKYFSDKPYYVSIMELFHETTLQTIIGQNLDLMMAPTDHVDFTHYTLDGYRAIVKWKTAFYSFYLPVALAMYMVGIDDAENHKNAKEILLKMGEYFQIQDDYLDCFCDPKVTGKVGTDIEDNKCGWLVVQALMRCNDEQRKFLEANYAQKDSSKVAKVKELYKELKLQELYHQYEEESYKQIMQLTDTLSGNLPKEMFTAYANKIFRRGK
ncbi:hypothetical protein LSH36_785g01038 [Paralvinella palmiformis]|uniref:Farnesyl pyrophosphate synthase n=1 Tax=Paralvinella palmiformis TaxID=53620 RepID=A0AAD9MSF7_9ANNE|nr:hypothetical protein LSH36_785g01038 [Paralvinella palmiformis]